MASFGAKYGDAPGQGRGVHKIKGGGSRARKLAPATPAQIKYLEALGHQGPWDLTKAKASNTIERLKTTT